tara:strand:- start:31 stop:855 length:825 start_codon:yes stop_codon:yes gene_type:complete
VFKHLDLCSGIGGFALGLQSTDFFKTIGFCEIDPYCQKVLKKNFPNVPIFNDIKELKPKELNLQPDIITAGFPCQPFSVAGKQKGKNDDRNLWKETFRIIKESRPTFFIGENVGGIVKLYLDTILQDLESEGYSTRCFNISASSIGAKHRRERIWIVSYSNAGLGIGENKEIQTRGNTTTNGSQNVSNSHVIGESTRLESSTNGQREEQLGRASTWDEQCQENWWQIESKFCGVPNGVSYKLDKDRANRIKGLGNAIVPQIPYYIGLAIKEMYE